MATTSSESLYDSVTGFTESGFAHASDTRSAATDLNRILSDIRSDPTRIDSVLSNPSAYNVISSQTIALRAVLSEVFSTAEPLTLNRFASAVYVAEKVSNAGARIRNRGGLGDFTYNGVAYDGLGTNIALANRLSANAALQQGLISNTAVEFFSNTSTQDLLSVSSDIIDYIDPSSNFQTPEKMLEVKNLIGSVANVYRSKPDAFFYQRSGSGGYLTPSIGMYRWNDEAGAYQLLHTVQTFIIANSPNGWDFSQHIGYNESYSGVNDSVVHVSISWPETLFAGSFKILAGSATITVRNDGIGSLGNLGFLWPLTATYQRLSDGAIITSGKVETPNPLLPVNADVTWTGLPSGIRSLFELLGLSSSYFAGYVEYLNNYDSYSRIQLYLAQKASADIEAARHQYGENTQAYRDARQAIFDQLNMDKGYIAHEFAVKPLVTNLVNLLGNISNTTLTGQFANVASQLLNINQSTTNAAKETLINGLTTTLGSFATIYYQLSQSPMLAASAASATALALAAGVTISLPLATLAVGLGIGSVINSLVRMDVQDPSKAIRDTVYQLGGHYTVPNALRGLSFDTWSTADQEGKRIVFDQSGGYTTQSIADPALGLNVYWDSVQGKYIPKL